MDRKWIGSNGEIVKWAESTDWVQVFLGEILCS